MCYAHVEVRFPHLERIRELRQRGLVYVCQALQREPRGRQREGPEDGDDIVAGRGRYRLCFLRGGAFLAHGVDSGPPCAEGARISQQVLLAVQVGGGDEVGVGRRGGGRKGEGEVRGELLH